MRLLLFHTGEDRVVDFFNLSLLADVAAKIEEQEGQEKENHARVSCLTIKLQEETQYDNIVKDESRRQVMTMTTTKKRKQERHHMMPYSSNKKPMIDKIIRSPTSSFDHRHRGWIEAHVRLRASSPIWICDKLLTDCDTIPLQNCLLLGAATVKDMLLPHLSENQKYQLFRSSYTLKEDGEVQQQQRKKGKEGLKVVMIDEMGGLWNNVWMKQDEVVGHR